MLFFTSNIYIYCTFSRDFIFFVEIKFNNIVNNYIISAKMQKGINDQPPVAEPASDLTLSYMQIVRQNTLQITSVSPGLLFDPP